MLFNMSYSAQILCMINDLEQKTTGCKVWIVNKPARCVPALIQSEQLSPTSTTQLTKPAKFSLWILYWTIIMGPQSKDRAKTTPAIMCIKILLHVFNLIYLVRQTLLSSKSTYLLTTSTRSNSLLTNFTDLTNSNYQLPIKYDTKTK